MRIAGLEKCSFVDYPGHLAAVVFTQGCNWNCFYCHNRSLVGPQQQMTLVEEPDVLSLLESRHGLLDGVVITGGEPTLQPDLPEFIRKVKAMGFKVKLDTNGTRPEVVSALLAEGLVDYVAMDLKAPLQKYETVCGTSVDLKAVSETIDLVMASGVEYEFRTTIVPQLDEKDVLDIAKRIQGARRFVLQQYRKPTGAAPDSDPRLNAAPHESTWPWTFIGEVSPLVGSCEMRGFEQRRTSETAAA